MRSIGKPTAHDSLKSRSTCLKGLKPCMAPRMQGANTSGSKYGAFEGSPRASTARMPVVLKASVKQQERVNTSAFVRTVVKDVKFLCSCEAVKWLRLGYDGQIWRRPIASTILRKGLRHHAHLPCASARAAIPLLSNSSPTFYSKVFNICSPRVCS